MDPWEIARSVEKEVQAHFDEVCPGRLKAQVTAAQVEGKGVVVLLRVEDVEPRPVMEATPAPAGAPPQA